jgi:hypothetical protein
MLRAFLTLFLLPMILHLSLPSHAPAQSTFTSPPTQVHLIELYTSQGCSSCPPAEAWVSNLKKDPALWKQLVPVVFHVNYWDHLGWPDTFASPLFTRRQRDYSNSWNKQSVYTPGFVFNGEEWRGWFQNKKIPQPPLAKPGILSATLQQNTLQVLFTPDSSQTQNSQPLLIEVALLTTDQRRSIQRGENAGRELEHNFVVLHLAQLPAEQGRASFNLPASILAQSSSLALWVRHSHSHLILQATGGWLRP